MNKTLLILTLSFLSATALAGSGPIVIKDSWSNNYKITMPDNIGSISQYLTMLSVLRKADKSVTVTIFSQGYGGQASTISTIMEAISTTKSKVTIEITGPSYSAHAFLACSSPNLHMSENSFLMFHTAQGRGFSLKMRDMDIGSQYLNNYLFGMCSHLLTKEDIIKMSEEVGEVYLTPDDVKVRSELDED